MDSMFGNLEKADLIFIILNISEYIKNNIRDFEPDR